MYVSMYPQIVRDTVMNQMEFARWMMLGSPTAPVMKATLETLVNLKVGILLPVFNYCDDVFNFRMQQ